MPVGAAPVQHYLNHNPPMSCSGRGSWWGLHACTGSREATGQAWETIGNLRDQPERATGRILKAWVRLFRHFSDLCLRMHHCAASISLGAMLSAPFLCPRQ